MVYRQQIRGILYHKLRQSMHIMKVASVFPEPVGSDIKVWRPLAMAGQPPAAAPGMRPSQVPDQLVYYARQIQP